MGSGWRKVFCTSISQHSDSNNVAPKQSISSPTLNPTSTSRVRLGFFSNSSTPRSGLRCRTPQNAVENSAGTPAKSRRGTVGSNPSSPRSPLKLSLFNNSFKFRSSCGICWSSVKTGNRTAIYTAECGHEFHFPCIVSHVRNQPTLICPVCNGPWKHVPLLAAHLNFNQFQQINSESKVQVKTMVDSSINDWNRKNPQENFIQFRLYDDDETLLSPTAGGRINPIPEYDESANQEFQGFFVDPKNRTNVQVRLLPETALISSGYSHETFAVALRVKAPPSPPLAGNFIDTFRRPPVDLVAVLDVGGSMAGAKLAMLKRAMHLMISSLSSSDRLAVVVFSASSKRLFPLRRMTAHGQLAVRRVIDTLVCSQGTNVGEALRKATKVLLDRREKNPVPTIMVLSDSQTGLNQLHKLSTRFVHIEIPVHSFGIGEIRYYNQEPVEDAFAKTFSCLLSVVVQDLRIQIGFTTGSSTDMISAIYSRTGRATVCSLGSVRLGDMYAEEERELLVELKIPTSAAGAHHVMTMKCLYKDPSTQEVVYSREQEILRPTAVGSSSWRIERLRNTFIATRAVAESRRLIEYDDHTRAIQLLASARALLTQTGSRGADVYVREVEVELAEIYWRRQQQLGLHQQHIMTTKTPRRRCNVKEAPVDENGDPMTPTTAWRAAEKLAKVTIMKKSLTSKVGDLHGFENARF